MEVITESKIFVKSIDLGYSTVNLRNDGIIQVNYGDDLEIDLKEAEEIQYTIGLLTEGKKALVLNIAGKSTSATSEARNHSASPDGVRYTIADAFVINSLAQKILANFYINFHKPLVNTKFFDTTQKAVDWLKSQLV